MEDDDLEIDNLLDVVKPKKKIKSGQKGKSAEREIVHILNERFKDILANNPTWGEFSRSVGSGNRWGQNVILSNTSIQIYAGDLTCPDNFLWVVESKKGYNDADIFSCFGGKCEKLDEFLKQVEDDATRTNRKPLLIWKKDRKERVCFVKQADLPIGVKFQKNDGVLSYRGWLGFSLTRLLEASDGEFFRK